ncbi:MAG: cytochrome c oxidase accessory protein CcoG [Verrucomicrobiae bacterium]|nr:cytochrome c oxidase accessory protein CcoG [Verrucomicrobiae bacterium]NNJ43229.1 cytochrome c oxidase accessory protein CcoG [Akkermansiaceae bacterium]
MAENKNPNLDSVTTINQDGSHFKLHPANVSGKFTTARRIIGFILIVVYATLPWIPINGNPAVFLDTANREFHLFGISLDVQDLWVLFFFISGLGFILFFVTSLLGRIWCGWTCPYTVFLDHIYRAIERAIEGDAPARKKLDAAPLTGSKILKRMLKHGLFILCSTLIAHIFISYFVSLKGLYGFIQDGPRTHTVSFGAIAFLTATLYFCFAWFREQFCVVMCPYGRIQSALSDDNTMVIGYDEKRGDPRGKASDPNNGDCIDCRRCINVCPTGIDIRDGLQLECIGCAACIDACDEIMVKIDRPKGLVRYSSHNALNGISSKIIRPRFFAYLALMLLGTTVFAVTVYKKARPFNAQINKMTGSPYQKDNTGVRNIYQVHLSNKRNVSSTFDISLQDAPEWISMSGTTNGITLTAKEKKTYNLVVIAPAEKYEGSFNFTIVVKSRNDGMTVKNTISFAGPSPKLYRKNVRMAKDAAEKEARDTPTHTDQP